MLCLICNTVFGLEISTHLFMPRKYKKMAKFLVDQNKDISETAPHIDW